MKRILIVSVILLWGLCLVGCNNNEFVEEDFKCVITVDNQNVKVGDTIKIKVKLENVSGKNAKIKMSHTDYKSLEDMISIGTFKEGEEHDFIVTSKGGPRKIINFKKNEVVTKELSYKIEDLTDYEIMAAIYFYVGKNYSQGIAISSDIKKISVTE